MFVAAGPAADRFAEWVGRLGGHCQPLGDRPAPDHRLLFLDARSVLTAADSPRLRQAMERSKRHGALTALDLGPVDWIRAQGGSRIAYRLAAVQPDILFASEEAAAELAAPLEGIASIPVLLLQDVCVVHGRHIAGPAHQTIDPDVFAAAFCVALDDGAAPVEAAARALLVPSVPRGDG